MNKNGKIYVVGIGPGKKGDMTFRAYEAMEKSDVIVGYKTYTDLVKEYYPNKEIVSSSMMKELARFGGDVSPFVPEVVKSALEEKYTDALERKIRMDEEITNVEV